MLVHVFLSCRPPISEFLGQFLFALAVCSVNTSRPVDHLESTVV